MKNWKMKLKYLVPVVGASTALMAFPAFAEGTDTQTVVTAADWAPILTPLTAQITPTSIVAALATFIATGIGLVFMWWGVRKLVRTVMSAFRKGKLSV